LDVVFSPLKQIVENIFRLLRSEYVIDFVLLFVISLIPLLWFRPAEMMVGHDNVFPLNPQEFFRDRLYTWSEHHGFGYDQSRGMGSMLIHLIDITPYYLGFDLQTTQKIVYCFWFFMLMFSAYIFSFFMQRWGFITHRYLRIILPILYAVNFFVLQAWWIGERTKFSVMVTLPLLLILFIGVVYTYVKPVRAGVIAAMLLFFFNGGGMMGLPLFGGVFIGLVAALIYFGFFVLLERRFVLLKKIFVFFFVFISLLLLLDAYFLLPFLSHTLQSYTKEIVRIGGAGSTLAWSDMISKDATIINLLRFQGIPDWYTALDHPYGQQFIHRRSLILASFLWPVLLVISFFVPKSNKEKRFFFFICFLLLLSLIFTRGTGAPTGFIYRFLVENIPGFAIFRSPLYKFGYAYWFSGSVLIGWTIAYGLTRVKILFKRGGEVVTNFICVFLVAGILLYHYPYLTGEIFAWSLGKLSTRLKVPQYVYDTANFVQQQGIKSRILLLPDANRNWQADVYQWKFFSLYPLLAYVSRKPFVFHNDSLHPAERSYLDDLYSAILQANPKRIQLLSSLLNIEFVLLRNDYYSDLTWISTTSPNEYKNALKKAGIFSPVKQFGEWELYRIDVGKPSGQIFVSRDILGIIADDPSPIRAADILDFWSSFQQTSKIQEMPVAIQLNNPKTDIADEIYRGDLYIAECVNCKALTQQTTITRPQVIFLPDSVVYPFIDRKRQQVRFFHSKTEEINYLLGMSMLRVEELVNLKRRRPTDVALTRHTQAIVQTVEKLKTIYGQLYLILAAGSRERAWIENMLRMRAYLTFEDYLLTNPQLWQEEYYRDYFEDVLFILRNLSAKLDDAIHLANLYSRYYYYPHQTKGEFLAFLFANSALQPLSATSVISGTKAPSVGNSLNLMRSSDEAFIVSNNNTSSFERKSLQLTPLLENSNNSCFGYALGDVDQNDVFRIETQYTNQEREIKSLNYLVFSQDATYKTYGFTRQIISKKITLFPQSSRSESYVFAPQTPYESVFVGICKPFFTQEEFTQTVSQFSVYKITSPVLFLWSENKKWQSGKPADNITVTRINQTKYKIDVNDNKSPFFLNFQERYDADWLLYKVPSTKTKDALGPDAIIEPYFFSTWLAKPLAQKSHFVGNGYMNSWYIPDKGSYSLFIEYRPQKLFYMGVILTISGWIGILGYFVVCRRLSHD
jgi:hypothetical protein